VCSTAQTPTPRSLRATLGPDRERKKGSSVKKAHNKKEKKKGGEVRDRVKSYAEAALSSLRSRAIPAEREKKKKKGGDPRLGRAVRKSCEKKRGGRVALGGRCFGRKARISAFSFSGKGGGGKKSPPGKGSAATGKQSTPKTAPYCFPCGLVREKRKKKKRRNRLRSSARGEERDKPAREENARAGSLTCYASRFTAKGKGVRIMPTNSLST